MNAQQERFCQEYLIDLNATQAALRAGYSPKTAYSQGQRLLKHVEVAAQIQQAMDERSQRVQFTADEVLAELKALALSDIRHYAIGDAQKPIGLIDGAPDIAMRAISSVKRRVRRERDGEEQAEIEDVEYRLWDKPAALRMAGQHLGMFKEIHELTGKDGEAISIEIREAQDTLRSRIGRLADRLGSGNDAQATRPHGNGRRSASR